MNKASGKMLYLQASQYTILLGHNCESTLQISTAAVSISPKIDILSSKWQWQILIEFVNLKLLLDTIGTWENILNYFNTYID